MEFVVLHTICYHFFPADAIRIFKIISNPLARKLVIVYHMAWSTSKLVLGPLLFTLYINDINSSTSDCPKLFVDDTCLILQESTLTQLYNKFRRLIIE